jgi:hypothetical protein|tara:strand:+ start:375 stop:518 length:144 start_codon:yes stop_codon:yes gene_type:complete
MNIVVSIIWNGLMIGVRHFEPDKNHPYFEMRIYLLLIELTIFIDRRK